MAKYLSDEVYKQTKEGNLISEKVIRVGLGKAIAILATAILGAAGASVWATLRVANTIPFRVDAVEAEVKNIKNDFMPLNLSLEKWKNNDEYHKLVISRIDTVEKKVDEIKTILINK